ncbi:type I-E CRISPR-associated protein Cse1/CasA [Lactobacillus sp. PSON]|uniref:type I-E CRISPR-associated protein Cse1/CasA n=1 Tax=Lactobacillus sp. PSON TaxID=3455454 RepID=UPI0040424408
MNTSFNLVEKPWIKVIDFADQEQLVSLSEVFQNASQYRQLAGDTKSQDLAILRFLLAILTRVYFDSNNKNVLLKKWNKLYQSNEFTPDVFDYLNSYKDSFDLFGEKPFYQVTEEVYNQHVEPKKQIKNGKGTVAIKQMNRTVSESNNTPSLFSPKSESYKNKVSLAEFTRWIISYQNYTGVTDKTKMLSKDKFSVSSGWLYGLNPFFIKQENLFKTLMYNLVLDPDTNVEEQKPVWEYDISEYLRKRVRAELPDNISELYTLWSRMLHIEWSDAGEPTIFTAGLPKVDSVEARIEPMTTWRYDKKIDKFKPAVKSKNNLDVAMWRNFGQYIGVNQYKKDSKNNPQLMPGLMHWLQVLKDKKIIDSILDVDLVSVSLISDGNATSQSPYAEVVDNMRIKLNVLFDENPELINKWPIRIDNTINQTQTVGKDLWIFAKKTAVLLGLSDSTFASRVTSHFYDRLNNLFYGWLASISADDNQDKKILEWKNELEKVAAQEAKAIVANVPSKAIMGRDQEDKKSRENIFTAYNSFHVNVVIHLDKRKKKNRR